MSNAVPALGIFATGCSTMSWPSASSIAVPSIAAALPIGAGSCGGQKRASNSHAEN